MVRVQKCWVLRVTDIKFLFCSSPLLWWCGPDLLQGDLSTALSRCKPWDTGVIVHLPPPEEGQFITCTFQTNYNTLVHSSPRRHWARLKNFSTWRFVANCVLGGYVLHHPASPPSFGFFSLLFSRIFYSCSFPHLSLLSGCPFLLLASHLWGQWCGGSWHSL